MIVEANIVYRTDFVPKRGRNVRRGYGSDVVPIMIRELADELAPVAMTVGIWPKPVRTVDGFLYAPVDAPEGDEKSVRQAVRDLARTFLYQTDLAPGRDRMSQPVGDDATVETSRRDMVAASLQERIDGAYVLVDGVLHERVVSDTIPTGDLMEAYGYFAMPPILLADEPFVPAWFPPAVDGRDFADVLRELAEGDRVGKDAASRKARTRIRKAMDMEVVDEALYRQISRDPRNLDLSAMVAGTSSRFDKPHLLQAVAEAEARAGTPGPEIARILDALGDVADKSRLPNDEPKFLMRGTFLSLQIHPDSRNVMSTMHADRWDVDWSLIQDREHPRLLFAGSDHAKAVALGRSYGSRKVDETDPDWVTDWNRDFDFDSFNLKSSLLHILGRVDGRLRFLSKQDLDAVARASAHLRDWQADPRLVDDPETERGFVRDAETIVSLLDGPVFEDLGRDWFRETARSCCAIVVERSTAETAFEDDVELRGFAF